MRIALPCAQQQSAAHKNPSSGTLNFAPNAVLPLRLLYFLLGLFEMLRDAAKLTFGCALVTREFFSTSTARSSLLTALTDFAGLTRGRVHPVASQVAQAIPSLEQLEEATVPDDKEVGPTVNDPATTVNGPTTTRDEQTVRRVRRPRERPVPATPLSRMANFAGMGASIAWGTMEESMKRIWVGPTENQIGGVLSPFFSEKNVERLALGLCKMRGAALKLGQMLSIQDETIIPAPLLAALESVRQGADVMPKKQLHGVLVSELGPDWRERLHNFEDEPMAAASIGQVHRATLKGGQLAVMKIQYPGVAESIDSDIDNLKWFLDRTNLLPRGLYLDQAIKVAKSELAMECDYRMEARSQKKFKELLAADKDFYVPVVYDGLSTRRVLTTELVPGVPIDKVATMNQDVRNHVGSLILKLTLKELFEFRFMQTDPNWSNFLYDVPSKRINLIDFGAARSYPANFVDNYLKMVMACANKERAEVLDLSIKLGFLTGEEAEVMLDAHTEAAFVVGMPFAKPGAYDFKGTNLTARVSELGATMLRHRLKPPPDEAYSLHRKLSGAFLACIKLGAIVNCREMLLQAHEKQKGA